MSSGLTLEKINADRITAVEKNINQLRIDLPNIVQRAIDASLKNYKYKNPANSSNGNGIKGWVATIVIFLSVIGIAVTPIYQAMKTIEGRMLRIEDRAALQIAGLDDKLQMEIHGQKEITTQTAVNLKHAIEGLDRGLQREIYSVKETADKALVKTDTNAADINKRVAVLEEKVRQCEKKHYERTIN